jgi:GR25 family glycosyltransferase involved in LPS biosynthesis
MCYTAIPAFCINLPTRPERWQQAAAQFSALGWSVQRQPGVQYSAALASTLSAPAAGCLESHRAIWRRCISADLPIVAVFEDDVVFSSEFKDIFARVYAQLSENWAVLFLHSFHARCAPYSADLVRITGALWGSHAYFVTQAACRLLLDMPSRSPVDCLLSRELSAQSAQVFGVKQQSTLAFQRGDASDIPATAQLDFWRRMRRRFGA